MIKEEKIKILNDNIDAIENKKYSSTFNDGGYSYTRNLISIFAVLNDLEYSNIYNENMSKYDKKDLEQNVDPDSYTLIECIVYFNWLWHLEGSGRATGIIEKRIKEGKYLKALKRFKELIENS